MPRKAASPTEIETQDESLIPKEVQNEEIETVQRLLASVLNYLSDDEVEEMDFDYLLDNTEGLREWWEKYRESNRKQLEEEIKKSLSELSLKDLQSIHEKIKEK